MSDRDAHTVTLLDGNALAGLLSGVFAVDVTMIVTTCGGCGLREPLAVAMVERDSVCAIVRCRGCTRTQFTVLEDSDGLRIQLAALGSLRVESPGEQR